MILKNLKQFAGLHSVKQKMMRNRSRYFANQKDQRFLRFIDFDAKYFNQVPFFFKPLQPLMTATKEVIMTANSFVGMPWWAVLILSSAVIRLTIFPLIMIQMRRMTKLAPISPIFVMIKDTWRQSQLSRYQRIKTVVKLYWAISKKQNIKMRSIFIYNMAYYPLLISMIFSMRKLLAVEEVANTPFLHLANLSDIDPYFILPTLTIGLYYWNFERFITNQNRNTLLSKIRIACQYFLILWYPFLCCWPSGIVLYMCTNAFISVLQTNALKKPWLLTKINEKMIYYNFMMNNVEHDTTASDAVIQAIKTGGQTLKHQQITQQVLFQQTEQMVKKLNKDVALNSNVCSLDGTKNKLQQEEQAQKKEQQRSVLQNSHKESP